MEVVNIHEAKIDLSWLIDRLASSGGFIIAKAGRPIAKVMPLRAPDTGKAKRLGFMVEQLRATADFDRMNENEVESLFGLKP